MNQLTEVSLENISAYCKPYIFNMDPMPDKLSSFSYSFKEAHVYGIISQPGGGAWALSYLLAGRVRKYSGTIIMNGEKANGGLLESNSVYVGEGLQAGRWIWSINRKTILEQLEEGDSSYSVGELIELLDLSDSRMDRSIQYISNERWNASVAIGLAHSRQLFCFPWFDSAWKSINRGRLKHCAEVLRANKKIMIIPSDSTLYLENIVDEIIYL